MKRKLLVPALVSLLATSCLPYSPVEKEMRALIFAAAPEEAICPKFSTDRQASIRAVFDAFPSFTTREEALAALSLIEARPTEFPESRAAARYFMAHHEELLNSFNRLENARLLYQFADECENILTYRALGFLFQSEDKLKFSAVDRLRLRQAAASFLWERVPDERTGIILYAVQAGTLDSYLKHSYRGPDKPALVAASAAVNQNFETNRKLITKPGTFWQNYFRQFTVAQFRAELKWHEEFVAEYRALLEKVFPRAPKE